MIYLSQLIILIIFVRPLLFSDEFNHNLSVEYQELLRLSNICKMMDNFIEIT